MTAGRPVERRQRKRRGLLGILMVLVVNLLLMSVLAWFVLLIGFGVYRIGHSREAVYQPIQAIVQPNLKLLQQNTLLGGESNLNRLHQIQRWIKHNLHWDVSEIFLERKLQAAEQQLPQVKNPLQHFWKKLKIEILPLFWGVTSIVITRLLIVFLSFPLFILCLSLGFVDGLVQRDIRRFQGARESTLLFHELKRGSAFWFFVPLFIYFLLPWPVLPQWFLVPLAIGMGLLTQIGVKSFKKYV